ncbi:hypothetical protein [Paracoccus sp. (in: a-proteobacteria)]|uniref:hypothetical protein n=1 Tax=Paracoccus sp. TaxID=267 RepID=UPI00396CB950
MYLYHPIVRTLDFLCSMRLHKPHVVNVLARPMEADGLLQEIVIDHSAASWRDINLMLEWFSWPAAYQDGGSSGSTMCLNRVPLPRGQGEFNLGFKGFMSACGRRIINTIYRSQFHLGPGGAKKASQGVKSITALHS